MKVLFLCPEVPFPLHGGDHIRQYHLLKNLADKHEIDLLCLAQNEKEMVGTEQMRKFCRKVKAFPFSPPQGPLGTIKGLLGPMPYYAYLYLDKNVIDWMQKAQQDNQYDIIQFEHGFLALYRDFVPKDSKSATILTVQNFLSFKYRRDSESASSWLRRFYTMRESKRWLKEEQRRFPQFDCLATPSTKNKEMLLENYPKARIEVIENGADTQGIPPCYDDDGKSLCFIGSLGYAPNRDALRFFFERVYPTVIDRHPEIELLVVGANPPEWVLERSGADSRITVTGYVDSVSRYLNRSTMLVVPLLTGGGTRLKILEAFAAGKAVVSTSVGAEGIECQPGKEILIADRPEDFARAVSHLLENRQLRQQLGHNARTLVEDKYSWPAIAAKLGRVWEALGANS